MAAEPTPYRAYKDSGVASLGEVPAHWEVRQLGRLGRLFKGGGGTKEDEQESGVPCVRYGDLYTQHQFFITKTRARVTPELANTVYTPIRYGDVLFAGSGETIDEIGKSAVNLIPGPACCGGDVIILRPSIDADARFLGYAMDCAATARQKASIGRGFTVVHVYSSDLRYVTVAIPSPSEQAAIVRFLDDADRRIRRYISSKENLIALLEEERKAAAAEALQSSASSSRSVRLNAVAALVNRPVDRVRDQQYTPIGLYNRGRGIFKKDRRRGADLGDSDFYWVDEGDLIISGQFAWEGAVAIASRAERGCIASHRYPNSSRSDERA